MAIVQHLQQAVIESLGKLYGSTFTEKDFQVNQTKPEFEGDYTVVMFALVKQLKKSPDAIGNELGEHLTANYPQYFSAFNIIKGFLNLTVSDKYWQGILLENFENAAYGRKPSNGQRVVIEYSSPNTNKPLHLGHLRNNFLGWSTAEILKANGYEIIKTCIANDRGIHICKSMVSWLQFANGATPQSTGIKGDHFVGDYYVMFGDVQKKQMAELMEKGMSKEEAEKEAPIMKAAQQMLVDWEAGKPDVMELWRRMNSWVYEGFDITYHRIGTDFDKVYYESETYILGKKLVEQGLQKGVFFKKEDGSVWIDLTADGLDEKIVQRRDGTSVYITQDIGLAVEKYEQYKYDQSIYVVADEQNYHFKVLKLICQKLDLPSADGIYHLSYGMVELPTGRMKTREGTVVDADDLVEEIVKVVEKHTEELGKVEGFTAAELKELYDTIGLGALKFYLLRVDPKKRMIFNPEESIDIHGFTGPFVQYSYARTQSILRTSDATDFLFFCFNKDQDSLKELSMNLQYSFKLNDDSESALVKLATDYLKQRDKVYPIISREKFIENFESISPESKNRILDKIMQNVNENVKGTESFTSALLKHEKDIVVMLEQYPDIIGQAAIEHNPSVIASYAFQLAQAFNSFYNVHSIANAESEEKKQLRLRLAVMTSNVLKSAMQLLGSRVPERM